MRAIHLEIADEVAEGEERGADDKLGKDSACAEEALSPSCSIKGMATIVSVWSDRFPTKVDSRRFSFLALNLSDLGFCLLLIWAKSSLWLTGRLC